SSATACSGSPPAMGTVPPRPGGVNIPSVADVPSELMTLEALLSALGEAADFDLAVNYALPQLLERDSALILHHETMPVMHAFEAAELIRQRPRLRAVPIIFMTAGSDDAHALRGYSLGAVDYVQTPVVPDVLRTKVRVFVDLFRKTEELRAQAEERIVLALEQVKRAAAEEAGRLSAFLAEAGKSMARSRDLDTTAQTIRDPGVPELGDVAMLRVYRGREEAVYVSKGAGGAAWSPPAGAAEAMEAAHRTLSRQVVVDRVQGAETVRALA